MKTVFTTILLFMSAITLLAQYTPTINKLVWAEEFNYEGHPNPEFWGYEEGYIRNKEAQYYTRRNLSNVRVDDGCLVIEARKEKKDTMNYTSGSINTLGNVDIYLGRVEVRAKIPTGVGSWPAIWLLGTDRTQVGWPECGEIDMMENVGYDPKRMHFTIHTPGTKKDGNKVKRTATLLADDAFTEFHEYALEWYEDRLDFFFDKKLVLSYKKDENLPEYWRFDKPHYLLLNLAVGGGWGGARGIDDSIFPLQYYVDWVRYYK